MLFDNECNFYVCHSHEVKISSQAHQGAYILTAEHPKNPETEKFIAELISEPPTKRTFAAR